MYLKAGTPIWFENLGCREPWFKNWGCHVS